MTQPKFAPIAIDDEVRPVLHLPAPEPWVSHRPGEYSKKAPLAKRGSGVSGSDQGYALLLAERFADHLKLAPGEQAEDALRGAVSVALSRGAIYGRAPVLADVELGLSIFGLLDDAPAELVEYRRKALAGVAHDSWRERELAESVAEQTLVMSPAQVRAGLAQWPSFFVSKA